MSSTGHRPLHFYAEDLLRSIKNYGDFLLRGSYRQAVSASANWNGHLITGTPIHGRGSSMNSMVPPVADNKQTVFRDSLIHHQQGWVRIFAQLHEQARGMNPYAISTVSSIFLQYIFSSRHRTEAAIHLQGRSSTRQQLYTEQMLLYIYLHRSSSTQNRCCYIYKKRRLSAPGCSDYYWFYC